jgi:LGFP repeat
MSTFPIAVDATRLFYRSFIIPNVTPGFVDARSVQTLHVSPGDYSFQVQSGVFSDLAFTVSPDGKIDYDVSCDAFLSGRGTSALNLNGFEVTIDASSLSGVPGGGGVLLADIPLTNDDFIQRRSIRLLPQTSYAVQQGSGVVARLAFRLGRDGFFSYAPELDAAAEGPLVGAGTSTLTFKGHTILVDATAVSRLLIVHPIWGLKPSEDGKASVVVLPADNFFLQLDRGVTDLGFSIGTTGSVTPDPGMTDLLEVDVPAVGGPLTVRVLPHEAFQSPVYGLNYVKGAARTKWLALAGQKTADGVDVQAHIGIPIENVQEVSAGRAFVVQRFERGMLVDVQGRNAPCAVYGAIGSRYRYLAEFTGNLGAPVSDEEPALGGGRKSFFDGGVVHWRGDVGAHETHGDILVRWNALGGPTGILGYPISDELPVMQGGAEIGRVSRFEAIPRDGQDPTVAAIYWSAATGAHEMYGPIFTAWQTTFGGPTGILGLPTSGPSATPNGQGRLQNFQKGFVVWHTESGPVPITGGIVLNLFSFTVSDDDFNVQVDVTSKIGGAQGPTNHGRIPADGQFDSGQQDFPPTPLLTFNTVTSDLVISVNQMEAISERTFGEDARKGNIPPLTYSIDNVWGLTEADHSHHDGSFTAVLAVQPIDQVIDPKVPFRKQMFWPFHNFGTGKLTWAQYEATFRDVAEADKHISIIPPRMHLLEIAVYEAVYNSLAQGGNCFGMGLEAIYAREHRSLFVEPIFTANSYKKDGAKLVDNGTVALGDAEAVNQINVKMGYQIGSEQIGWFLGKWTVGALHDPVRAFRESRDAYARGDWPMLTMSDKDKFSQEGHVVLPYAWDPSTELQIGASPLSGQTWTIFVANPNSPAAGGSPPADNDITCKVVINPFEETWSMVVGAGESPWSGSSRDGGRLLTMPYSVLSDRPTSPADLIATLLETIAAGALMIMAGDGTTAQITDARQRTIFRTSADGKRRINEDPESRIPDLALLPVHERGGAAPEVYVWRPNPATAGTQLHHVLQGHGNYTWSLVSPALSATIVASGVGEGAVGAAVPGDQILIEQLGTADQAITHINSPGQGPRVLHMSVAGWPSSDISQAKWFELADFTASPGHILRAQVLNAGRSLTVHNDGPDAGFHLSVHSGLDNDPLAVRLGVRMPSGKAWRIEAADWSRAAPDTPLDVLEMDKIGGPVLRQFRI